MYTIFRVTDMKSELLGDELSRTMYRTRLYVIETTQHFADVKKRRCKQTRKRWENRLGERKYIGQTMLMQQWNFFVCNFCRIKLSPM